MESHAHQVMRYLEDGAWHSLSEIAAATEMDQLPTLRTIYELRSDGQIAADILSSAGPNAMRYKAVRQ